MDGAVRRRRRKGQGIKKILPPGFNPRKSPPAPTRAKMPGGNHISDPRPLRRVEGSEMNRFTIDPDRRVPYAVALVPTYAFEA